MRVKRFGEGWQKRVFRVEPEHRAAVIAISAELGVTTDGAVRLALRAYVARHGHGRTLAGWKPVQPAKKCIPADLPKAWVHLREEWVPVLDAIRGPAGTFADSCRDAIIEFYAAGAAAWRAAMTTPA